MKLTPDKHEKIQRVLRYIHDNLEEKHTIQNLAEIGHLSPYYFHRLIRMYLDEPIGTYIKRIRLETGYRRLWFTRDSITDIAYSLGYESHSAFSKAFLQHFNESPTSVRNRFHEFILRDKDYQKSDYLLSEVPQTTHISSYFTAYIFIISSYGSQKMIDSWDTLRMYSCRNGYTTEDTKWMGMCMDDPRITAGNNHRYQACISLNTLTPVKEENIYFRTFEGGKYYSFIHKGPYDKLIYSMRYITGQWLFDSGIELREAQLVENYLNNPHEVPPEELLTEILLPVAF